MTMAERDAAGEHDRGAGARDAVIAERNNLRANRAVPLARHGWHVTASMHACSRTYRRLAYLALRPIAHRAKPMLLWLAHRPAARKLLVSVLGRHSRLVNTARLFLIGAPTASPPVEVMVPSPSPEAMAGRESLSARGREVLSMLEEMRTQAKGETQRASGT